MLVVGPSLTELLSNQRAGGDACPARAPRENHAVQMPAAARAAASIRPAQHHRHNRSGSTGSSCSRVKTIQYNYIYDNNTH